MYSSSHWIDMEICSSKRKVRKGRRSLDRVLFVRSADMANRIGEINCEWNPGPRNPKLARKRWDLGILQENWTCIVVKPISAVLSICIIWRASTGGHYIGLLHGRGATVCIQSRLQVPSWEYSFPAYTNNLCILISSVRPAQVSSPCYVYLIRFPYTNKLSENFPVSYYHPSPPPSLPPPN